MADRPFIEFGDRCPDLEDDGGDTHHCFHLLDLQLVCCWCGDLFNLVQDDEPKAHGEYAREVVSG
jgi:hypothetical protein